MITIDGSQGEGGGQILRTSLALSLVTGQPFRIHRIRARRQKPGLLKQHLTAVRAAASVGGAEVCGDALESQELQFKPGPVVPGDYRFAVGTAGSATLVLQTVLPALLNLPEPTTLTLEGGTHNPMAPPFDFLQECFVPLVNRMGPSIELKLERRGFYPAGGGKFRAFVRPTSKLSRLDLIERGSFRSRQGKIILSRLAGHVVEREITVLRDELKWAAGEFVVDDRVPSLSPGNAVILTVEAEHVKCVFTAIGERGLPAEAVARSAAREFQTWFEANVPVDEHLADQLLVPMVLAGGGSFRTVRPSLHATTNAEVLQMFMPVPLRFEQESEAIWRVEVG